jgi:cytochrome c-type biogenesis protein
MESVSLLTAFIAGIASFISPCVLPLIPMYISFISGLSLEELQNTNDKKRILERVTLSSLLFVLGFSFIFIGLGASATVLGKYLLLKLSLLSKIAGIVIIILGLHIAGVFKIGFLNYEKRFHFGRKPAGSLGPFLIGLAFAFGWTPCVGPVLAPILALSAQQETVKQGILLLSMYSLGLAIPFLLTGISINAFLSFTRRIQKHYKIIEIITGVCLIIMGILFVTGSFSIISSYMVRWLPWLAGV